MQKPYDIFTRSPDVFRSELAALAVMAERGELTQEELSAAIDRYYNAGPSYEEVMAGFDEKEIEFASEEEEVNKRWLTLSAMESWPASVLSFQ